MASTPRLGRVFVSSVFGELLPLRAEMARLIGSLGLEAVNMEHAGAAEAPVGARLEAELAPCDLYVGVFDKRRGTVPAGGVTEGRAITEEEYHQARKLGLRRLVFYSLLDNSKRRNAKLAAFLEREVFHYTDGVWARPFKTHEDLRRDLLSGLSAARPRVGLALARQDGALVATLDLSRLGRAWTGPAQVGPFALSGLDEDRDWVALLRGQKLDSQQEIAARFTEAWLPEVLRTALTNVLAQAGGRLLVLTVASEDAAALHAPWELLTLPGLALPVRTGALEVVRRVLRPGEDPGAPTDTIRVTAPNLSLLGFTPSPIEDQELVAGVGAAGHQDHDLFWEQEQDRLLEAMEPLLRAGTGRLLLPDEGDAARLEALLGLQERPSVLHLACHGGFEVESGEARPVVLLEDAEGHRRPTTTEELLGWARANPSAPPLELVVLSACQTAAASPKRESGRSGERGGATAVALSAPSLVLGLVQGGVRRALGFLDSVSDAGATAFAHAFYGALAEGLDLAVALRRGRAGLAAKGAPQDWALAALFVQDADGPLVAPLAGDAAALATETSRSPFLVDGVTYLEQGYVGRRWLERDLFQAFHRGERLLVLHGIGGIGKSSLAARFLVRRAHEGAHALSLYAGQALSATSLLEEVAEQLKVKRPEGLPPEETERAFEAALSAALRAETPTLLLLDNFEDQQEEDGSLRDPALSQALLRLLHLGEPGFVVLVTTRLELVLPPGPVVPVLLPVGDLSPTARRKLRSLDPAGLGRLEDEEWRRAQEAFGGHPKALHMLSLYLRNKPEKARHLITKRSQVVAHVQKALAAKEQERGRRLLLDELLAEVPTELHPAFDRLCLLRLPIPAEELEALLAAEGIAEPAEALDWLRQRGLLAPTLAPGTGGTGELVHRLVAEGRETALAEREGAEALRAWHQRVAKHLVQPGKPLSNLGPAAEHLDAAGDRAGALGLYSRWAATLLDSHAYKASEEIACDGIRRLPASLDEQERAQAANLWLRVADALEALGDPEARELALDKAKATLADFQGNRSRAVRGSLAVRSATSRRVAGDLEGALRDLRSAVCLFESLDQPAERERAIALGRICDVLLDRGEFDEALCILQTDVLPAFDRLGDQREHAQALGRVADILFARGELDEALYIRREKQLPVCERLRDERERAVTLGKIADILFAQGKVDEVLRIRREEELPVYERLGDERERAVTLGKIADVLFAQENFDEVLRISMDEQMPVFERLGEVREHAVTLGRIADVLFARGELDEPQRILREALLPAFEHVGDVRSRAATRFKLAQIAWHRENFHSAIEDLELAWQDALSLRSPELVGRVGLLLGQLAMAGGGQEDARLLLSASAQAFRKLGQIGLAEQAEAILAQVPEGE